MASFCRIANKSSHLPCTLSALEEQTFLFQLQLQDKAEDESSEVINPQSLSTCESKFCGRAIITNACTTLR